MKPTQKEIDKAFDELDPYEHMEYAVGSGDDFVCFSWAVIGGDVKGLFDKVFILKAVLNSETGSFIQEFGRYQCDYVDSPHMLAMQAVNEALQWCCDNNVRHSKKGWNHDAYFLVREIWHHFKKKELEEIGDSIPWKVSERQLLLGGKKINKSCGLNKIA